MRGKVYTGHVGDSAIILGRREGGELEGEALTVDHKPDSAPELARIHSAGGQVQSKVRPTNFPRVSWVLQSRH